MNETERHPSKKKDAWLRGMFWVCGLAGDKTAGWREVCVGRVQTGSSSVVPAALQRAFQGGGVADLDAFLDILRRPAGAVLYERDLGLSPCVKILRKLTPEQSTRLKNLQAHIGRRSFCMLSKMIMFILCSDLLVARWSCGEFPATSTPASMRFGAGPR